MNAREIGEKKMKKNRIHFAFPAAADGCWMRQAIVSFSGLA